MRIILFFTAFFALLPINCFAAAIELENLELALTQIEKAAGAKGVASLHISQELFLKKDRQFRINPEKMVDAVKELYDYAFDELFKIFPQEGGKNSRRQSIKNNNDLLYPWMYKVDYSKPLDDQIGILLYLADATWSLDDDAATERIGKAITLLFYFMSQGVDLKSPQFLVIEPGQLTSIERVKPDWSGMWKKFVGFMEHFNKKT